jgi:hypothetical protein
VLQPVIQLRTAIHGKSFSGGALNRAQKLMHLRDSSPSKFPMELITRKDSSKSGCGELCNAAQRGKIVAGTGTTSKQVAFVDSCRPRHVPAAQQAIGA